MSIFYIEISLHCSVTNEMSVNVRLHYTSQYFLPMDVNDRAMMFQGVLAQH